MRVILAHQGRRTFDEAHPPLARADHPQAPRGRRRAGKGVAVPEVCEALGIAESTYYRWRDQFGGIKADEMRRLKELERENARLEALVADLSLDKATLKEARPGKLVSPARRRQAVLRAMTAFQASERRACRALGVPRSSQRYVGTGREPEEELLLRIRALAREDPRYGYRRIRALLVREGWSVNLKRVHRLWRREGLEVPQVRRKRRRLGQSEDGCIRRRSERPNHVGSYDFIHDQTADGRGLKMLPVVDEFTRECLTIEVERHLTANDLVSTLEYLFEIRGEPEFIRSDNGPEFI